MNKLNEVKACNKEERTMKELQGMHCDSNGCHLTPYNISKEPVIKIKMFSDYSAYGAI